MTQSADIEQPNASVDTKSTTATKVTSGIDTIKIPNATKRTFYENNPKNSMLKQMDAQGAAGPIETVALAKTSVALGRKADQPDVTDTMTIFKHAATATDPGARTTHPRPHGPRPRWPRLRTVLTRPRSRPSLPRAFHRTTQIPAPASPAARRR